MPAGGRGQRRSLRRSLLHRGGDHRHLLPAELPGGPAEGQERALSSERRFGAGGRLPGLQGPARVVSGYSTHFAACRPSGIGQEAAEDRRCSLVHSGDRRWRSEPEVGGRVVTEQTAFANVAAQHGQALVAGLGHNRTFGGAGGGGGGGEPGPGGVLLHGQGDGTVRQAGRAQLAVPVDGGEQRPVVERVPRGPSPIWSPRAARKAVVQAVVARTGQLSGWLP